MAKTDAQGNYWRTAYVEVSRYVDLISKHPLEDTNWWENEAIQSFLEHPSFAYRDLEKDDGIVDDITFEERDFTNDASELEEAQEEIAKRETYKRAPASPRIERRASVAERIRGLEQIVTNEPDRAPEFLVLALCEAARQLARIAQDLEDR